MKINLLFSETTGPFSTKICMYAIRYKEMKIHYYDAGHMTKMAVVPIYGKKTLNIFPGSMAVDRFRRNLVRSIGDSNLLYFVQIITLG